MGLVVAAAAVLAFWVAGRVTRPVDQIIDDVRTISHGQLKPPHQDLRGQRGGLARALHRAHERRPAGRAGRQARAVDRERELSLAATSAKRWCRSRRRARRATTIGAVHLSSANIGGDFHDYIELQDGRVGLLVCDVSGQGMPAALIGAIARSYLRGELLHVDAGAGTEGVSEALRRANRWIGRDVRRGIYATALYALVDPQRGRAIVASAGHKIPLLRVSAGDGKSGPCTPRASPWASTAGWSSTSARGGGGAARARRPALPLQQRARAPLERRGARARGEGLLRARPEARPAAVARLPEGPAQRSPRLRGEDGVSHDDLRS
jgi:hypothetical protein